MPNREIRVPPTPTTFSTFGSSFDVLAEDGCGNYFTKMKSGEMWFWDHETDEIVRLGGSLSEFVSHCTDPQLLELHPN